MKYHSYFSMFIYDYGDTQPLIEGEAFVKLKEPHIVSCSNQKEAAVVDIFPLKQFYVGGETIGEFLSEVIKFSVGPTVSEKKHSSPSDDWKLQEINNLAKNFTIELDKKLNELYPSIPNTKTPQ